MPNFYKEIPSHTCTEKNKTIQRLENETDVYLRRVPRVSTNATFALVSPPLSGIPSAIQLVVVVVWGRTEPVSGRGKRNVKIKTEERGSESPMKTIGRANRESGRGPTIRRVTG